MVMPFTKAMSKHFHTAFQQPTLPGWISLLVIHFVVFSFSWWRDALCSVVNLQLTSVIQGLTKSTESFHSWQRHCNAFHFAVCSCLCWYHACMQWHWRCMLLIRIPLQNTMEMGQMGPQKGMVSTIACNMASFMHAYTTSALMNPDQQSERVQGCINSRHLPNWRNIFPQISMCL